MPGLVPCEFCGKKLDPRGKHVHIRKCMQVPLQDAALPVRVQDCISPVRVQDCILPGVCEKTDLFGTSIILAGYHERLFNPLYHSPYLDAVYRTLDVKALPNTLLLERVLRRNELRISGSKIMRKCQEHGTCCRSVICLKMTQLNKATVKMIRPNCTGCVVEILEINTLIRGAGADSVAEFHTQGHSLFIKLNDGKTYRLTMNEAVDAVNAITFYIFRPDNLAVEPHNSGGGPPRLISVARDTDGWACRFCPKTYVHRSGVLKHMRSSHKSSYKNLKADKQRALMDIIKK